ncbi:MAG: hypothetical protein U1F27_13580 [Turneriella sp.]
MNAKRNASTLIFAVALFTAITTQSCNSMKFIVADADYYSDGYKLDGKYVQLIESVADKTDSRPAAERFAENCVTAENQARARFKGLHPTWRDEGKRIGERFDKNAGCTVRMAFKTE